MSLILYTVILYRPQLFILLSFSFDILEEYAFDPLYSYMIEGDLNDILKVHDWCISFEMGYIQFVVSKQDVLCGTDVHLVICEYVIIHLSVTNYTKKSQTRLL